MQWGFNGMGALSINGGVLFFSLARDIAAWTYRGATLYFPPCLKESGTSQALHISI